MKCFEKAIEVEDINGKQVMNLNFKKSFDIANSGQDQMIFTGFIDKKITNDNSNVGNFVKEIVSLINNNSDIDININTSSMYEAIKNAFINLKVSYSDAWIFWQREEANKTSYQYNIASSTVSGNDVKFIFVTLISLNINVNIDIESVLGITVNDIHEYSIRLNLIQVAKKI